MLPRSSSGMRFRRVGPGLVGLATALVLVGAVTALSACGSGEPAETVLTVDQALAVEEGETVRVQGMLVVTEGEAVLASALLESYPPQAGGSTLSLQGLDVETLVGLSSTVGEAGSAQVAWSDYSLVLEGVMEDGVLEVTGTPPVAESSTEMVRIRFTSPVTPLPSGDAAWWVLDMTNLTDEPLDLTFPSGQKAEVVLHREGSEQYRWSKGKVFTQAVTIETLQPGATMPVVLNDTPALTPGEYEVTATVKASAGPEGSAVPLPEVNTSVTVVAAGS